MSSKITTCLAVACGGALLLAGCASSPDYPVTYQIPIGFAQTTSAYGIQNLNVSATHDSTVPAGEPMYYQINSPVPVTLYVFDKTGSGPGGALLNQMQGTNLTATATSSSGTLEFVVSAAQQYTSGTVQLTISDHHLPPSATAMGTTQMTTVTTVAPGPMAPAGTTTTTTYAPAPPAPPPTPVMNRTTGP
jgi:hypothetical protein